MLFFAERKERKEAASLRLDRLCGRQRFGGGYERRRPRSLRSRDPSTAAPFASIAPDGAHTARALRLRARAFQPHRASARRMLACRAKREQTTVGSRGYMLLSRWMRVRDGVSVSLLVLFSSVRKAHIFSLAKEKRVLFLYEQEKNEKKSQTSGLTVGASQKCIPSAPDTCLRTAGVRKPRRNTPNGRRVQSGSLRLRAQAFQPHRALRMASGGLCEPCEHCNTFRAVGMRFPAEA